MEKQPIDSGIRRRSAALLGLTQLFGINSMFGQAYRSGWIDATVALIDSAKRGAFLPLSQRPILTRYTGWPPLDKLLMLAAIMFANVVDGSSPALSLYAVQFGGQLVPVFAVMMIEGLRVGNTKTAFYYSVLWGYLMQMTGYATTMPLYCCLHLLTSHTATRNPEAVRPRHLRTLNLKVIVPAFTLGYGVLSILFAYPFSSNNLRQWLCAIWQGFPHFVVGLQYLLSNCNMSDLDPPTRARSLREDHRALSKVYNFAFNVAATTQLFSFAVLVLARFSPTLFPRDIVKSLTFSKVFKPGPFFSHEPLTSMATEMHRWFLYDQYVGSAAALIWALALYLGSVPTKAAWTSTNSLALGWDILRWTVIAGPAGALVRLLQHRDGLVLLQTPVVR